MRAIKQVQIPPVAVAVVLFRCIGSRQRMQFGCGSSVVYTGTKTDSNLQAIMFQWIGRPIGREIAKAREREPRSFGKTAKNSQKAPWGDANDGERMLIDGDCASDQHRIGIELAAPERIGKNDFVLCPIGTIIGIGLKQTS